MKAKSTIKLYQPFSEEVIKAAKEDAIARFPEESCGFVIDNAYVSMPNSADFPKEDFVIRDWPIDKTIQGVLHSHPNGPRNDNQYAFPTANDMVSQQTTAVPYGIVWTDGRVASTPVWWGDQLPVYPLLERPFIHGILDCYSLIRDYYRSEKNIILRDFPRDFGWWTGKARKDLYRNNFVKAGFGEIMMNELQEGDVILGQIFSNVTNHGGIYLGNGQFLDHLFERCSVRRPITPFRKRITHCLRYVGQ